MSVEIPVVPGWEFTDRHDPSVPEKFEDYGYGLRQLRNASAVRGFYFGPGDDRCSIYVVIDLNMGAAAVAYSMANVVDAWKPDEFHVYQMPWTTDMLMVRCWWD